MAIRFGNGVTQISCAGCNEVALYQTVRKNEAYRCFADDRWYVDATDPVSIHYCRQCGPVQNSALPIQAPGGARGAQPPGGARGGQAVDLSGGRRGPSNPGAQFHHDPPLAKGAHDPRLAGIVVSAGSGGADPVDIDVDDVTMPMDGSIRVYRRGKDGRTDPIGPITVPDDAKQDLRDKLDRAKDAFRLTLTLGDEECMTSLD